MRSDCDLGCAYYGGERGFKIAAHFHERRRAYLLQELSACHRPGEIAPMSLMTFKDAPPWAKSIREKVLDPTMPPWHADPKHGSFKNDRRLSKKDIDTIIAWVDGGAAEGNPKDLTRAPSFTEGWQMGKPDVVLSMAREYSVPAEGVVNYQYFLVPTGFTEDKWIQAAEVRPGNRTVVHHVIVFVVGPDALRQRISLFGEGGIDGLVGTAPGEEPMVLPEGVGRLVKAGSILVLQMHYTPNGTAQKDRTSVGILFSRKPIEKSASGGAAMNRRFAIPPGDGNYEVRSVYAFKEDSHIMSLMPHMHGKDFEYRLIYPDGTSKVILSVPRYSFTGRRVTNSRSRSQRRKAAGLCAWRTSTIRVTKSGILIRRRPFAGVRRPGKK